MLKVTRQPHDHDLMVIECYDSEAGSDDYVGGCMININCYKNPETSSAVTNPIALGVTGSVANLNTLMEPVDPESSFGPRKIADEDGWVTENFALYDNGHETGGDAGLLQARIRWVDDESTPKGDGKGFIMFHLVRGVGLKNVDLVNVQDMHNFDDSGAILAHFGVYFGYMLVGLLYFMIFENWGALDTLVFVTTTFTTVGYGNHPSNFTEPGHEMTKLFLTFYILFGLGLLGAMAGVVGGSVSHAMARAEERVEHAKEEITDVLPGIHLPGLGQDASEDVVTVKREKTFGQQIVFPMLTLVVTVLTGAVVYALSDGLNYLDAVYFTVVTASTTGYGDYVPLTITSRLFTIFYVPLGVCMLGYACHTIARIPMELRHARLQNHVLSQFGSTLNEGDFMELKRMVHKDPADDLTRNDFSLAMLMRLGVVRMRDLERVEALFKTLDKDHSLTITAEDIKTMCEQQQANLKLLQDQLEAEAKASVVPDSAPEADVSVSEIGMTIEESESIDSEA